MLVGVLRDGFLKIAVKTSAFPTTATGVKTAAMIEVKMKNVSYFSVISAACRTLRYLPWQFGYLSFR